ncbi:uncharacterized protein EDB91DRAFT_1045336, partial [Suillus paluster]|uniref:uncharacterized protein n=1 Tax=Suillus paluster TaxID=48578 RepID=UPI001B8638C1
YWCQFKYPLFIKEYAPVPSIQFSPSETYKYAVTAATCVQIYTPQTQKVTKMILCFKDVAYSGNIHPDGKLIVAGDDTDLVQVFDINSHTILHTLDSHKQSVHITRFSPLTPPGTFY